MIRPVIQKEGSLQVSPKNPSVSDAPLGAPISAPAMPKETEYPSPKNKGQRVDVQLEPASSQMCVGLADSERIKCLCPRPVRYSLEPLPPPDTDNYAGLLTIRSPREPMYKVRVFLRAVFSEAVTTYPTDEMLQTEHFSIAHGFMAYDPFSFVIQVTKPQKLLKIKVTSSTGPRVICVNQEN
jgi:hypothetical protein